LIKSRSKRKGKKEEKQERSRDYSPVCLTRAIRSMGTYNFKLNLGF